jgi:hypothetical protein
MGSYRKRQIRDPYEIPKTVDEELAMDGANFITLPDQWPSEPLLKKPEQYLQKVRLR